jgi:hypothetical protein
VSQLDQQIVKKIKLLHVIVLNIASAVVAKKMVQLRDAIWKILVADAVDHIDMFPSVKVVETQPVSREIRAQPDCCAREDTQQAEADKELSEDGVVACHRGPGIDYTGLVQRKQ